jgi:hypothetical protein
MEAIDVKEFGGPDVLEVLKLPFPEADEQLLLERTELNVLRLELDNPKAFADE